MLGIREEEYTNNTLSHEDFEKFVESIKEGNCYVVSTSDELTFIPTLAPSFYLENINFTNLLVYGRVDDTICHHFQGIANEYMKTYLEQIDAEEFLSQEKTENEKGQ